MESKPINRLQAYLSGISDIRQAGKIKHPLESILFMAVAATIANAGSWEEIADFAKGQEDWFRRYVELPNGVPAHDTFERVFKWVDGAELERSFVLWMREICKDKELGVIAVDGKTMRGSADKGKNPLHIVSAWSGKNNLVLGQVKTEDKSNEIKAIPKLLQLLELKGSIVTIDAMGTQEAIARQILKKKADYVLSVKKNQPTLYEAIDYYVKKEGETGFADAPHAYTRTLEKGHGRIEKREYYLFEEIGFLDTKKWNGLGGFGMVKRTVCDPQGEQVHEETGYYITSLKQNIQGFASAVRDHWGIEAMHWSLDVVLNEDRRIVRKENGPRNLAVLKRMALNMIRADTSFPKATGPQKRFRACWDSDYLETVLRNL